MLCLVYLYRPIQTKTIVSTQKVYSGEDIDTLIPGVEDITLEIFSLTKKCLRLVIGKSEHSGLC